MELLGSWLVVGQVLSQARTRTVVSTKNKPLHSEGFFVFKEYSVSFCYVYFFFKIII
jgi:hypothetical protein